MNRTSLEKAKCLYPGAYVNGHFVNLLCHNSLADSLSGKAGFPYLKSDDYFSQLFQESSRIKAERIILSAEHFFGGEPRVWEISDPLRYINLYQQKIERLSRYLNGCDVLIIVYLRHQEEWLASAISHVIKIDRLIGEGGVYKNDRQFFELSKPLLRYTPLLDSWGRSFFFKNIIAVPYQIKSLKCGSSVTDFLSRADLNHIHYDYRDTDIRENESLSIEYVEVKKLLNSRPKSKHTERSIISCLEKLSKSAIFGSHYSIDSDVMRDLRAYVLVDNEILHSKYGCDLSYTTVGEMSRILTSEDVSSAFEEFQREYRAPKYLILRLGFYLKHVLRTRFLFIHVFLQGIKNVAVTRSRRKNWVRVHERHRAPN